jgi:hypothetical protein
MAPAHDRAAVLIVRAWLEGDQEVGLRARILEVQDLAWTVRTATTAGSVDEVCAAVCSWLQTLLDGVRPQP